MKTKLIGLAILVIMALCLNTGCKGSGFDFDINGEWEITITYDCGAEFVVTITFSGTTSSGDVYLNGMKLGSYSVSDKNVSFSYQTLEGAVTYYYDYTGEAKETDEMEGDIEQSFEQPLLNAALKSLPIKVPVSKGKWKGRKKKK